MFHAVIKIYSLLQVVLLHLMKEEVKRSRTFLYMCAVVWIFSTLSVSGQNLEVRSKPESPVNQGLFTSKRGMLYFYS